MVFYLYASSYSGFIHMFVFAFLVWEMIPVQIVFLVFLLINRDTLTDIIPGRRRKFNIGIYYMVYLTGQ